MRETAYLSGMQTKPEIVSHLDPVECCDSRGPTVRLRAVECFEPTPQRDCPCAEYSSGMLEFSYSQGVEDSSSHPEVTDTSSL